MAGPASNAPRLYVDAPLSAGEMVEGTAAHAHYLIHVMRHGPGDTIRLFNGRDGEWSATIAAARKDRVAFRAEIRLRPQDPEPECWLLFSPLKRDATDFIIEKATELGASVLMPVLCERTNTARFNAGRALSTVIEAAEQCERLTIPQILEPRRLFDALGAWPRDRVLAAAVERAPGLPRPMGERALLVGPEGGFAPGELDVMRATPFIHPVSLGPRVLRAETAALAGLAMMLSHHP